MVPRPLLTHLFVGLLITENIFAINGLGRHLVSSIYQREYFLLLNGLLVFAVLMLVTELMVDVAAAWLNPT
jgi:ABC-type dipeptide/oligopeptide/nickel transport system permease component